MESNLKAGYLQFLHRMEQMLPGSTTVASAAVTGTGHLPHHTQPRSHHLEQSAADATSAANRQRQVFSQQLQQGSSSPHFPAPQPPTVPGEAVHADAVPANAMYAEASVIEPARLIPPVASGDHLVKNPELASGNV